MSKTYNTRLKVRSNLQAEEKNNQGNNFFKNREYDKALRCYSDAIQLCPKNVSYLCERSECYTMMGRYKEALEDALKITQIDTNFEKGYVRVAKSYLCLGILDGAEQAIKKLSEMSSTLVKTEVLALQQLRQLEEKARECYDKEDYRNCLCQVDNVLKYAPASREYRLMKVECLLRFRRVKEANDIFITITKDSDTYFVQGLLNYSKGEDDESILYFKRAQAYYPDHKHCKLYLIKAEARKFYTNQEYDKALRCNSEALQLCPTNVSSLFARSKCYIKLGRYSEALDDARNSIQINKNFKEGYIHVAKCCLALGDLVGAEQAIKKLMEISSTGETLVKTEILALQQLRQLEGKAREYYNKEDFRTCLYQVNNALKYSPASRSYKLMKAECLALLGRLNEAYVIAITIQNSEAFFVRGLISYFKDNLDEGIWYFERFLTFDPDHKRCKLWRIKAKNLREKRNKGNELFKNHKFRDALAMYNEALKIDPLNKETNSKLYYNRALVNSKLGNHIESIMDCNDALLINPLYVKALLTRAKCYYDIKKFELSIADYKAVLKIEWTNATFSLLRDAEMQLKKSKRKDYYNILGIKKNATSDEIKKAYHTQALIHHPDKHSNATEAKKKEQEIKFKEIGEAYSILSDPNKRAIFDRTQDSETSSDSSDHDTYMDTEDDGFYYKSSWTTYDSDNSDDI